MATQTTQIALMALKIENIEKGVANIQGTLQKDYVTQDQHALTKAELARQGKILYFAVGVFALAVLSSIANLIIPRL